MREISREEAGGAASMAGALPLINMTSWLIGAIVSGGVAAKIILDKQENDEYHGLTQEQQAFA